MNSTLPMSKPIGIYEARTHLSQIFDDLVNGRCGPVPITRRGTKTVYLVVEPPTVESRPSIRFGLGKGKYAIVDDIDEKNDQVEALFNGDCV